MGRTGKSPGFFWQGLLILLPVVVLATAGMWSLQGQRQAAEEKARQAARRSAQRELERIGPDFRELIHGAQMVPSGGREVEPFPFLYPLNPKPPSDLGPDHAFQAALDDPAQLRDVLTEHPDARSASGLPLRPLVLYQMILHASDGQGEDLVGQLEEAVLETHPSVLSEPLLAQLGRKQALARWREQEATRDVLRSYLARNRGVANSGWFSTPAGETWRIEVIESPLDPAKPIVRALPLETFQPLFADALPADYLGYAFSYGGEQISPSDVADGSEVFTTAEVDGLVAKVFLTDPQLLHADHRRQTNWFIGIIATAAATALFGLWVARRAHLKQQAVNRMKSNFVSSVSHELRAPIASIRLMAERLRAGRVLEDEKRSEYFGFIEQESHRLATLVENVLDFSRIEDGRKTYKFEETDITQLAAETAKLMQPYAAEHRVTLLTELDAPDYRPAIDATEIQQALINLIDNAIKYSPEGESVTVGLENGDAEKLRLWVQDNGRGIASEEQAKIFQRFYRIGSELERETQGVGIGLAIVRHTAEAHSGQIRLDSTPGEGSRFTLELPLQR